ncbi:MAG TPA: CBS domain-containing protein [Polyangiaceae bacterium]|nr:CBS domain-containing protein [Polyangiaceae bacterium]
MAIADLMSCQVVTVTPEQDLDAIRRLFDEHRFHHVLVVDRDRLVGVISDRDLLRATSPFIDTLAERPQDLATLRKRAHQIMSREPIVAHRDDSVAQAAAAMLAHRVSCLPVVTPDGRVEGIVSWRDLMRSLVDEAKR